MRLPSPYRPESDVLDTLLARLDPPVPSVARYVDEVRGRVCAEPLSAGCAGPASPATSGRD